MARYHRWGAGVKGAPEFGVRSVWDPFHSARRGAAGSFGVGGSGLKSLLSTTPVPAPGATTPPAACKNHAKVPPRPALARTMPHPAPCKYHAILEYAGDGRHETPSRYARCVPYAIPVPLFTMQCPCHSSHIAPLVGQLDNGNGVQLFSARGQQFQ